MTNTGVVSSDSQTPSRPTMNGTSLTRPEQTGARVLVGGRGAERLDGLACLRRQLAGYGDLDRHEQVAVAAVLAPDALALDPEGAAVAGAGRQPEGHRGAAERRHLDLAAERRLGERHRHGEREVVAGPAEQPVRRHGDRDEQVARRAAALARTTLALEPDPLAVLDAGRDADRDAAGAHRPAAAPAVGARVVDDQPPAVAVGARLGEREPAGVAAGLARAVAGRAGVRHGAAAATGAVAGGQGCSLVIRSGTVTPWTASSNGRVTVDSTSAPRRAWVRGPPPVRWPKSPPRTSPRPPPPGAPPNRSLKSNCAPPPGPPAPGGPEPPAAGAEQRARLVVLLAARGVGEHGVGLRDLLEPVLGLTCVADLFRGGSPARACGRPS